MGTLVNIEDPDEMEQNETLKTLSITNASEDTFCHVALGIIIDIMTKA